MPNEVTFFVETCNTQRLHNISSSRGTLNQVKQVKISTQVYEQYWEINDFYLESCIQKYLSTKPWERNAKKTFVKQVFFFNKCFTDRGINIIIIQTTQWDSSLAWNNPVANKLFLTFCCIPHVLYCILYL